MEISLNVLSDSTFVVEDKDGNKRSLYDYEYTVSHANIEAVKLTFKDKGGNWSSYSVVDKDSHLHYTKNGEEFFDNNYTVDDSWFESEFLHTVTGSSFDGTVKLVSIEPYKVEKTFYEIYLTEENKLFSSLNQSDYQYLVVRLI